MSTNGKIGIIIFMLTVVLFEGSILVWIKGVEKDLEILHKVAKAHNNIIENILRHENDLITATINKGKSNKKKDKNE